MKSNSHLIEQLADLGVYLTPKEVGLLRKSVMRDRKFDKKMKKRKAKLKMISAHLRVNE